MEQFFASRPTALFFIGLLFLIISNKKDDEHISSNIIILYIIMTLVNVFSIINLNISTFIILLISFIDIEVININSDTLIVNTRYKIYDFIFEMINKYKFPLIYILNIILNIIIKPGITNFEKIIIYFVYCLFFISIISKIYRNDFKLKGFHEIEKVFLKNAEGFKYSEIANMNEVEKYNMLIDVEDKTYLYRKKSHSFLSIESLMFKVVGKQNYIELIDNLSQHRFVYYIRNLKKIIKYCFKIIIVVFKAILYRNGIKRFIKRGYSTIEMQWIRNAGIEVGYDKVYKRKFYELIYSNIFFNSLKKKRKYHTYPEYNFNNSDFIFKILIIHVYLKTVPTFIYINNTRTKIDNIYEFYKLIRKNEIMDKKEIISDLSKEEMFIFIMGLSGKVIDEDLFELYSEYIKDYNINKTKVMEIMNSL